VVKIFLVNKITHIQSFFLL